MREQLDSASFRPLRLEAWQGTDRLKEGIHLPSYSPREGLGRITHAADQHCSKIIDHQNCKLPTARDIIMAC